MCKLSNLLLVITAIHDILVRIGQWPILTLLYVEIPNPVGVNSMFHLITCPIDFQRN